jgi:hypothetical protein
MPHKTVVVKQCMTDVSFGICGQPVVGNHHLHEVCQLLWWMLVNSVDAAFQVAIIP